MLGGTHFLAAEHLMMKFIKQFESSRASMDFPRTALSGMPQKKNYMISLYLANSLM